MKSLDFMSIYIDAEERAGENVLNIEKISPINPPAAFVTDYITKTIGAREALIKEKNPVLWETILIEVTRAIVYGVHAGWFGEKE